MTELNHETEQSCAVLVMASLFLSWPRLLPTFSSFSWENWQTVRMRVRAASRHSCWGKGEFIQIYEHDLFFTKIFKYLNIFSLQGPELSHIRDRARIWQLCRKVGKYFVKHIQHLLRSKQYAWENCRRSLVKHYWIQTDLSKKVRIWHLIFTFDWCYCKL